ncbi:DNA-3-methyladenine glycosylase [Peptoniphilus indolicus ATCC 29427]|uniref:Putative 3-methyladenine DNA glycosylase n=2 Tax=Peptoniphilus indolicus TaxID=33030 RepID=G4D3Z2_9FIRM|nr:DNA-3-methyladenine glycosylase [Peptoniphilus indolicus ATCC 29427]
MVARELLGKYLISERDDDILIAKIVEVEAYLGYEDKAAHTYGGRRTQRTEVMYGSAGLAYVYFTYGMHNLLNVVTREKSIGEAVLIRAVEPISEFDNFSMRRFGKNYAELNSYQKKNITNGPAKLTKAMGIDLTYNGLDMTIGEKLYIVEGESEFKITSSKRIGIDYAEEAIDYLYRFYIESNKYVSK